MEMSFSGVNSDGCLNFTAMEKPTELDTKTLPNDAANGHPGQVYQGVLDPDLWTQGIFFPS